MVSMVPVVSLASVVPGACSSLLSMVPGVLIWYLLGGYDVCGVIFPGVSIVSVLVTLVPVLSFVPVE